MRLLNADEPNLQESEKARAGDGRRAGLCVVWSFLQLHRPANSRDSWGHLPREQTDQSVKG